MQKIIFITALLFSFSSWALDLRGRLGVGFTNQLANEIPALSVKVQRSKAYAVGALLGVKASEDQTLYGAGVKFYRIIFDEPQLNFYLAGLFATQNFLDQEKDQVKSGYQVDGTLGSEFHFTGLESIGFSFEFGFSARNTGPQGASLETLGDHFIKAAVHFYL